MNLTVTPTAVSLLETHPPGIESRGRIKTTQTSALNRIMRKPEDISSHSGTSVISPAKAGVKILPVLLLLSLLLSIYSFQLVHASSYWWFFLEFFKCLFQNQRVPNTSQMIRIKPQMNKWVLSHMLQSHYSQFYLLNCHRIWLKICSIISCGVVWFYLLFNGYFNGVHVWDKQAQTRKRRKKNQKVKINKRPLSTSTLLCLSLSFIDPCKFIGS